MASTVSMSSTASVTLTPSVSPSQGATGIPGLMPSITSTLSSARLQIQADVQFTSATAIRRFFPIVIRADDGNVPATVRAAVVSPWGSGAARTLLRSHPGNSSLITPPCSQLARAPDTIIQGACQPRPGIGVGGTRLHRHESAGVVASLWLAPRDCSNTPLSAAFTISPTLVFLSAYITDPRVVELPAAASDVLLAPFSLPATSVTAMGVYSSLRGILAQVQSVTWSLSGLPSGDAFALNASTYFGSLPSVHSFSWSSAALASAIPPYTLLPGYYYTASVNISLRASWAWDTENFKNSSFPAAPPPPSANVSPRSLETLSITSEAPWLDNSASRDTLSRSASVAVVSLLPIPAAIAVTPSKGTALASRFNLSGSGGTMSPAASAYDLSTATPRGNYSSASLASSLITTHPFHPNATAALLADLQGGDDSQSIVSAGIMSSQAGDWCAVLDDLASSASPDPARVAALPAWALALGPLAHALDIAAALDSNSNAPNAYGPDLSEAASLSASLLQRTTRATLVSSASLCARLSASLASFLPIAPLNASAEPATTLLSPQTDDASLLYSFRVGTRPLSALPDGSLASVSPPVFSSPDIGIEQALLYSVPLQVSASGSTTYTNSSTMLDTKLPLTLQYGALNISLATLVPVYVLVLDNAQAVSAAVVNVPLYPPISSTASGNASAISASVAELSDELFGPHSNSSASPLATVLSVGTLASVLGTLSTGLLVAGSAVSSGNVTSGSNISSAVAVVSPNTITRTFLLNVTAAALSALTTQTLLQEQPQSRTGPLFDDPTLGAFSLTIRSLSLDPFEISSESADSAVASLNALMTAALAGVKSGSIDRRRSLMLATGSVSDTTKVVRLPTQVCGESNGRALLH